MSNARSTLMGVALGVVGGLAVGAVVWSLVKPEKKEEEEGETEPRRRRRRRRISFRAEQAEEEQDEEEEPQEEQRAAPTPPVTANERLAHTVLLDDKAPQLKSPAVDDGTQTSASAPSSSTLATAATGGVAGSVYEQVRAIARRAFWDAFAEDMGLEPPRFDRFVALVREARDELLALLPARARQADPWQALDDERLHATFLVGHAEPTAQDVALVVQRLVHGILELEAPARNAGTRAWLERTLADFAARAATAGPEAGRGTGTATGGGGGGGGGPSQMDMLPGAMRYVFDKVAELKTDVANYRLQMLKPYLQLHGLRYEREKFDEHIRSGTLTLARTEQWLDGVVARHWPGLVAAALSPSSSSASSSPAVNADLLAPLDELVRATPRAYQQVHSLGVLALVTAPTALSDASAPETLRLDAARLVDFQNEVQRLTIVAVELHIIGVVWRDMATSASASPAPALLVMTDDEVAECKRCLLNLLGAPPARLPVLAEELVNKVDSLARARSSSSSATSSSSPADAAVPLTMSPEVRERLRAMVTKTISAADPVFQLMNRRIVDVVCRALLRQREARVGRASVDEGEHLAPFEADVATARLASIKGELWRLIESLANVGTHNLLVHAAHYNAVIRRVVARLRGVTDDGASSSAAAAAATADTADAAAAEQVDSDRH